MTCGYCKEEMRSFGAWKKHLRESACEWGREVWERHLAARARGQSGRRILSAAWPHLWKPKLMSEETKEMLREIGKKRIRPKKKRALPKVKKGRRRRRRRSAASTA